jgi:hypothetical protein
MAKFDPTRPYAWQIVAADTISGFDPTVFTINSAGANLFSNPTFGGIFSVSQNGTANSIFVIYTPVGTPPNTPIPDNYDVGSLTDTTTLLGYVTHSDVDALYLQPSATSISPQTPLTINLNVANLKQPIIGVDAYINFDSRFFVAGTNVTGQPQVVPGGGPWTTLITKTWNVHGDLDTVLAVSLSNVTGTSADGTVAKITLTPTRTATGNSRVVFRQDGTAKADNSGTVRTDLVPADPLAAVVLPARVMTDAITITGGDQVPVIDAKNSTATQVQPLAGAVNVKNGNTNSVRSFNGSGPSTSSGPVVITVLASDAGTGLNGPPGLQLANGTTTVTITNSLGTNQIVGPFVYNWYIDATTLNGTWNANISATNGLGTNTTVNNAFTLVVNTTEISGVVELQKFAGTNRLVTFKANQLPLSGGGTTNMQWDLNLTFTSGLILNAGAYQDRAGMAAALQSPPDPLSVYLTLGEIKNLPALAGMLANQVNNFNAYVYALLYGHIESLHVLADQLSNPTRSIDAYVVGKLSPATIVALAAYESAKPPIPNATVLTLNTNILRDYNTIVLGPSIYDPVRFASVTLSSNSMYLVNLDPHQRPPDYNIQINRSLLVDAYVLPSGTNTVQTYFHGVLNPETAQELANYTGGADITLQDDLLVDLETFTLTQSMWPPATPPFGQCIYNETVFLGISLSPATTSLLATTPFPTGDSLTLLNQLLLQDAFQGTFAKAPLTPSTLSAINAFDANTPSTIPPFETGMMTDLNAIIAGGVSLFTSNRFAPFLSQIVPGSELALLLANPNPTPPQLVRENRLLLELAYPQLSKSILAQYRLVSVPSGATSQVSAKTAWNLRVRQTVSLTTGSGATANFVGDGVAGAFSATDFFLRSGDLNGDNAVSLGDYNILRINFGSLNGGAADIDGNGVVNFADYAAMQINWAKTGDPEVQ